MPHYLKIRTCQRKCWACRLVAIGAWLFIALIGIVYGVLIALAV